MVVTRLDMPEFAVVMLALEPLMVIAETGLALVIQPSISRAYSSPLISTVTCSHCIVIGTEASIECKAAIIA